ncbi:MAG: ATP-binding protein [Pirellulales bacterium]
MSLSLSRRLVDRYLLFGLACLLACISLALVLSWRGLLIDMVPLTVAMPLVLLLAGAAALRRTVRWTSAIEEQLREVSATSAALESGLRPLVANEPAAIGWNQLLRQLNDQKSFAAIDARLGGSIGALQQRNWEGLFNSLSDGIAVVDRQGVVTLANGALAALLQADSPQSLVGQRLSDVLAASGATASPPLAEATGAAAAVSSHELRCGTEISQGIWRLIRAPLLGEHGPSGESLWTLRDVTQQKLAEEMRDQFLSAATHELRTPLANIKAYAETLALQPDIDAEEQKGFFNIINAEATRLARFVDELLNVSKMEAGALSIARHETDIARLLAEVVENVQPQARQKQVRIDAQLPPKLPELSADKGQLTAALANLLGNAVKYTPENGEVRLLVEVTQQEIQFHVEDTGIGIAPDELPRLFQKFFRSSDARVQNITGSGLGLAFAQEVARLHGGCITVRSELDVGSRFTLTLPIDSNAR